MPYVSLDNLARFHGRLRDRASSEFASLGMANWQKTAAAGAVSFSPVPEMPLDPVVNFLFTETGPASGTKGPDNPSTITGVTQAKVTRCGKNLLNMAGISGFTQNGVTFVVDSNAGTVTVTSDGPATADTTFYVAIWPNMKMYANQQYFLSGCPAGGSADTYYLGGSYYSEDGVYGGGMAADVGSGALLVKEFNWRYNCIIRIRSGVTVSNLVFKPQLELGSVATAFEPYSGADYTVDLGGTYYGGSVDLSAGVMTVTEVGYIFTGEENITKQADLGDGTPQYNLPVSSYNVGASGKNSCSHFEYGYTANKYYVRNVAGYGVRVYPVGYTTLESFVQWVKEQYNAGTPLTVVYTTDTPYTIQLTPTQIYSLSQLDPYTPRINTVYSDQVSVQAGYPKSPQATQNELTNAVVSLGGNL